MKQFAINTLLLAWLCAMPTFGSEVLTTAMSEAADTMQIAATDSIIAVDTVPPVILTYPLILLEMTNAHIEQDSLITLLMEEKTAGVVRGEHERPGFRVQIYSSNHPTRGKVGALEVEQRVKEVVSVPVYVIYATPSWKVRLGDFLSEQQAMEFRDTFRALFPDMADYTYIVRDQVKIR